MPFGPDCEYADFDACVRANSDKDDPEGWCARVQQETEQHCSNSTDNKTVDPELSAKRRRAGRRGAAARWGHQDESKPGLRTTRPIARLRQGRNDWYEIKDRAGTTAEVLIYDEIGYFGVTAQDFVGDLRAITAPQISLRLNTPGGDAFDGIAIYNALRDHPATVQVTIDALAASAGSFIAQAGDRVVMNRGSQMMIHDAWGLSIGNAADMRHLAEILDRHSDNIAAIYAERAGGTVAEWRALMRDESWFTADEAVDAGLADEVAGRDADTQNSFDLSVFRYPGRAQAPAPVLPVSAPDPIPETPEVLDFGAISKTVEEALSV